MPVAETTLRNVLVVSKHGIYYPRSNHLMGDLPESSRFTAKETLQLTERGKMMMVRLGKLLLKRYNKFINAVEASNDRQRQFFKLTAADSEVARSSANEVLRGMYMNESGKFKLEEGGSQYFDKTYITNKENSDCPKFSTLKGWNPEELLSSKHDPESDLVKKTLGIAKLEEVFEMYERLEMERLSGLNLPHWAATMNGARVIQAMRRLSIQKMRKVTGNREEGWKFLASSPLTSILEDFGYVKYKVDESYQEDQRDQKRNIHIHVTEDAVLYSLLWWLKLDDIVACSVFLEPSTGGGKTCKDISFPGQIVNTRGEREQPQYFAQVGDTLILEFHKDGMKNKFMRPLFLRIREEKDSYKGFWWLTMQRKLKEFGKPHDPASNFHPTLLAKGLISAKKWEESCASIRK